MSDVNLYDKLNYDNGPITTSQTEYDLGDFGINFQNGFKIPNSFVTKLMFKYLKPLSSEYQESRKTKAEINAYNIRKTFGGITISGRINGTDRANLIENIEHFKMKCRNRMNIVIKDGGVERIAKCVVDDYDFDENHYNLTHMKFTVTLSYRDYIAYNDDVHLEYLSNTSATKNIGFYNPGLETDFVGVLEINSGSNIDLTVNINGVDLIIEGLNSGDVVNIDTENISVKVNGIDIVFGGIMTKLEEGNNDITITNSGTGNYNFHLYYKKTIS